MIYFLSDAHLGSRAIPNNEAHQTRVIALLNRMRQDATAIYLLGDIFDFWYEYAWGKPTEYDRFLDTLRTLTQQGIAVHFFIGNHDIWTFGWLEKRTGIIVHRKEAYVTLMGKKCLLAHGDGLGKHDIWFRFIRAIFHNTMLQHAFRYMPPAWGNAIGYTWAKHSRQKELLHPVPYLGEAKETLVQYAKEQEQTQHLDYYIFGHRHIELDLELASKARVIILGDMFQQFTYAQMNENGEVMLCCDEN